MAASELGELPHLRARCAPLQGATWGMEQHKSSTSVFIALAAHRSNLVVPHNRAHARALSAL